MSTDSTSTTLESIQRRITLLRETLESADLMTNVSADGISETIDRKTLIKELADLERREAIMTGKYSRFHAVDTSRA